MFMAYELFEFIDENMLAFLYDESRRSTFTPFENPEDLREDEWGQRIRDKEYIICRNATETAVYTAVENGEKYRKVGYADYTKDKCGKKAYMKLWYLHVNEQYQGLGLGSMMIAAVKHECMLQKIDRLVLDAARRYKEKDETTELRHPELKGDGHFYNANFVLYKDHKFKIDYESENYIPGMEDDFRDWRPIPMVCYIDPKEAKMVRKAEKESKRAAEAVKVAAEAEDIEESEIVIDIPEAEEVVECKLAALEPETCQ